MNQLYSVKSSAKPFALSGLEELFGSAVAKAEGWVYQLESSYGDGHM